MRLRLSMVMVCVLLSGCAVISRFDQNTFDGAKRIKSDAMTLIPMAVEAADKHTIEIASLRSQLTSQVAYEEGKGRANAISCAQWKVIASEDHDLLGKFLKKWESGQKFSPSYLVEKKQQVSDALDQVLRLEGAKPTQ